VREALAKVLLQRCTLKDERLFTGLMHVFIFYGALTFDTMTLNHTLEGFFDGFYLFGKTSFGLFFSGRPVSPPGIPTYEKKRPSGPLYGYEPETGNDDSFLFEFMGELQVEKST
jgi:hypothetical protein